MPRRDCILFIEGQYPIYDQKALPFKTKRWIESAAAALPSGYKHPIRVVYNENTMTYRTLKTEKSIQFLDKKEAEFFKEAEKTDSSIRVFEMDEEDFLYLNWRKKPPISEEEITEIFQQAKAEKNNEEQQEEELPEDVRLFSNQDNVPDSGTEVQMQWDLSGSVLQCIKRYALQLSDAQLNEIVEGLEAGLSEKQIKSYFFLPAEKMNQYRRAYMFSSSKK